MVLLVVVSVSVLAALTITNVVTYQISQVQDHIQTQGSISASEGLTISRPSIDWGALPPGGNSTEAIQVTNSLAAPVILYLSTSSWDPPETQDVLTLSWNYTGAPLGPDETLGLALTLAAAEDVGDLETFAFNITITGVT